MIYRRKRKEEEIGEFCVYGWMEMGGQVGGRKENHTSPTIFMMSRSKLPSSFSAGWPIT